MKSMTITVAAIAAIAVGACSTKSYPIEAQLSEAEIELMDCRELAREALRAENVRAQINDTANLNWRSAAGFLGDFGIGNAMARNDAERALDARLSTIRQAQLAKNCPAT